MPQSRRASYERTATLSGARSLGDGGRGGAIAPQKPDRRAAGKGLRIRRQDTSTTSTYSTRSYKSSIQEQPQCVVQPPVLDYRATD